MELCILILTLKLKLHIYFEIIIILNEYLFDNNYKYLFRILQPFYFRKEVFKPIQVYTC